MKRNPSVELMRIIACLIVLACHCNLLLNVSEPDAFYRNFITGILCDGVTIFWMITGFFIFNNKSYKKLWLHTLTRILLPLFLLYIVDIFLADFLLGKASLTESMSNGVGRIPDYLISIIHLDTPSPSTSHTWYVFAYILVILVFPIIKAFASYLQENKKRQIVFLTITTCVWIANDALFNKLLDFSFHGAGVIIPSVLLVLWGYVIYLNKELLSRRIFILVCPIAFILVNMLRTFISISVSNNEMFDYSGSLFTWYSFFGVINAILVVSFCFSLANNKVSFINKTICFIASTTYGIYLIHPLIQESALHLGLFDLLRSTLTKSLPEWAYLVLAVLISTLASFVVCFVISSIIVLIKKLFILRK